MAQYPPSSAPPYQPTGPPQQSLASKVSLSFSCKGLLDKDITSKSDPMIEVQMMSSDKKWRHVGRTEHLKNTLNPQFTEAIVVEYRFEEVQKLRCVVYDVDNASSTLDDDDYLGEIECNLGQVVSSRGYTREISYARSNPGGHVKAGTMSISAEELSEGNMNVTLQFLARTLDKKDFLGKSDPYLEILKSPDGVNFIPVHRTPHIDNTLNPNWKPFTITLQKLCGNDYDMKLKISCYDYDSDGGHDLIGDCYTTMAEMMQDGNGTARQWDCISEKKKAKKKSYKNSGIIILQSIKVEQMFSFLDYVMTGCQMNFTVGIDFTGSNGDPNSVTSLHYLNPNEPNEYVKALIAVGEVCQDYDTDKMFPALGFGAKIPPSYQVSFEFPLNFNPADPYCQGMYGIVAAYQSCVRQIQFYGPTNLSPIINHVVNHANIMLQNNEHTATNYFVLLLLTDGVITDMDNTVTAIVNASFRPISLIIVGVGNADFTAMDFLDCDEGKLRDRRGQEACRDIVQFVPFRDFRHVSPAELAKAVLAEIPQQVTEYYKIKGIKPNEAVPVNLGMPQL